MQSSSFPASDYFDISSWNKKHFKVCIVCKGYRVWTICLFLHICFQALPLGPYKKRRAKGKACQEITKGIQERSVSAYICCEQTAHLEKWGTPEIWSIDPVIFLTSKTGFNLDRKLPLLGGKIQLCSLCTLYIDYRQYLPQCNVHWWPPQLSMEVIYRNFCDPTLTNLQSKEHMQLKVKRAVVPTTKLPRWAVQGKTEQSLPRAVFCNCPASLDSPDEPANLAGRFST